MFCNSKGNRSLKKSRQNSFQQSSQALKRHYTLRTSITSNEIPLEGLWNVLVFLNFFLNPLPWLSIIAAFFFFFLIKTSWRNCKENRQDMLFWTQAFQTILYLPAWKRLSGRERSDYWLLLRDAFFCLLRCSWETRLNEKEINSQPCKQVLLSLTLQADKDGNGNADLTCKSHHWDSGWRVDWSAYWCNWPLTIFLAMGWVISIALSQSQRMKMLHKVLTLGNGGFMFHWLTSDMAHYGDFNSETQLSAANINSARIWQIGDVD